VLTEQQFSDEAQRSQVSQQDIEESDTLDLETFLKGKS